MKFIVGLGNPGCAYRATRHNVGFSVLDRLARGHGIAINRKRFTARYGEGIIGPHEVLLIKPQTYMNLSGSSVKGFLVGYGGSLSDLIIVHDDVDLPLGSIRIRMRGGHGGHKGVRSVIEGVGSDEFCRLKVGIGRPVGIEDVSDYVLRPFEKVERAHLDGVFQMAVEAIEMLLTEGVERAMSVFHVTEVCEKKDM